MFSAYGPSILLTIVALLYPLNSYIRDFKVAVAVTTKYYLKVVLHVVLPWACSLITAQGTPWDMTDRTYSELSNSGFL